MDSDCRKPATSPSCPGLKRTGVSDISLVAMSGRPHHPMDAARTPRLAATESQHIARKGQRGVRRGRSSPDEERNVQVMELG